MSVRKDEVQLSIEINGVKAGQKLKELKQNARDLARELELLTPGTEEFTKKAGDLQKINNVLATIRKSTVGVATEFSSLPAKILPILDVFKKGGILAVAFFATEKVIEWGKEFVSWVTKGTQAMEDSENVTRSVFRDSKSIVESIADAQAASIRKTKEEFIDLATETGKLLNQLKFTRDESAKYSSDVATMAGQLAIFSNGTHTAEEANAALGKGLTGNIKALKEYGIIITDADVKNRLAAKGQNDLTGSALKQAKALAILELAMERTKDAQFAFTASQDSIAANASRSSVFFNTIKENILKGLIPAYRALTGALADLVAPVKKGSDVIAEQIGQYTNLIETLRDVKLSEEVRLELIDELNTQFGDLTKGQVDLNTSTAEYNRLLKEGTDELERRFVLEGLKEKLAEAGRDVADQVANVKAVGKELKAAQSELEKIDPSVGFGEGRSVSPRQQAFKDATLAVNKYTGALKEAQEAEAAARVALKDIGDIARENGIDVDRILNPKDVIAPDDPEIKNFDKILQDRLKKREAEIDAARALEIEGLKFMALDHQEFEDRVAIINITAEKFKQKARQEILRLSEEEQIAIAHEIADKEMEIDAATAKLSLDNTLRHIKEIGVLQRQAIKENITDQIEQQEALDQQILDEEIRSLEAQLKVKSEFEEGYDELKEKLDGARERRTKQLLAQNEREYKAALTAIRIETLKALEQQQLDEEDFLIAKRRLTLQYAIEDQEDIVNKYKEGTQERYEAELELQRLIADLNGTTFKIPVATANAGGTSTPEDLDKRKETLQQIEDASISTAQNIANAELSIARDRIEQQLNAELQMIDSIEQRKLQAAGDDVVAQKKIRAEADRDRLAAEKKAAQERKKIARAEAVIQGALAFVKALPDPIASAAAGIATAIQLAAIDRQSFYQGGFTSKTGMYRDRSGHDVAGVVHTNEWVANTRTISDPDTGPIIRELDRVQRLKRGFATGGYTSVTTTPARFNQPTATLSDERLQNIEAILSDMRTIVAAWPTVVKAVMAYTEFEKVKGDVDYIRGQSVA